MAKHKPGRRTKAASNIPSRFAPDEKLIIAIIGRAADDLDHKKPEFVKSAKTFFRSDDYRFYLDTLGLSANLLPTNYTT